MNHPPLFPTISEAILWLAAQPKAPKSPAFRALWIGAATTGGALTSNEVIAAARLSGLLDGIKITDANLLSRLPLLARCGLFKRVRPDTHSPTTVPCNGAKVGKRYLYVATKEIKHSTSEVSHRVPDEFIVTSFSTVHPAHYVRRGPEFVRGVEGAWETISLEQVKNIFHSTAHKVFTLRSTGNHYDA